MRVFAFVCVAIIACSGPVQVGDAEQTPPDVPDPIDPTPTPDPTDPEDPPPGPPQIVSYSPDDGAQGIWIRRVIEVTFDRPMDKTQNVADCVSAEADGAPVVFSAAWSDSQTLELVLDPALALPAGVTMSATCLRSSLGAAMDKTTTWSFNLPTWLELSGQVNEVAGNNAQLPFAVPRSDDSVLAAWFEQGADAFEVKTAQQEGLAWTRIDPDIGGQAGRDAAISGMISDGDAAYLSTYELETNIFQVQVHSLTAQGWEQLGGPLNVDTTRDAGLAALAPMAAGQLLAVFEQVVGTTWNLFAKQWDGDSWNAVGGALDAQEARHTLHPALLATSDAFVAAWTEHDTVNYQVVAKELRGGTWRALGGALDTFPYPGGTYLPVSLAQTGNGRIWATWSAYLGTGLGYQVRSAYWNGTQWTTVPVNAPVAAGSGAIGSRIAFSAVSGELWLTLAYSTGESWDVALLRLESGAWRTKVATLDHAEGENALYPAIAVDHVGAPIVTWYEGPTGASNIVVKRLNR